MSAIPPDIAGSAAQAGFASREASRIRDAARSAQTNAAMRQEQAAVDALDSVETSDGDTAVFADAEGAGGQGREIEETEDLDTSDGDERAVEDTSEAEDEDSLDVEA